MLLFFCVLTLGAGLTSFFRKIQEKKTKETKICLEEDFLEKESEDDFCFLSRLDVQGSKGARALAIVKKRYEKSE